MDTPIGQTTVGEILPYLIGIGISVLLIIFFIRMAVVTSRLRKEAKIQHKQEIENRKATISATFNHFNGLPVPENTICQIYSTPTEYQILCQGQQFNLAKQKVLNISVTTDTEIQKQYVSSAGGAIGGALLFGPVGALIGGRTKTKTSKEVYTYLIFTYLKEGESQYIAFDVTNSFLQAMKFIQEFEAQKPREAYQIEL